MTAPSVQRSRLCAGLAIAAYLVVALVTFRVVLPAPATLLPYPALLDKSSLPNAQLASIDHWDEQMVVATVIRNAHLLVNRPWALFDDEGQCYPMPRAHTLGEHMFGVGLLAAVPYALTGDPIASFNAALVLTIWIPAITMFFLARNFTRSVPAAFVAGLAFALVPGRIVDPSHPYVHGDLWAPAVLLCLHRLFVTARWSWALGFALFLSLEVAESLYPLISTCLVGGVYGLYLLFRHRENLPRVLPKLAVALGLVALTAWLVLGPYLETAAQWRLLAGRLSFLLNVKQYAPGELHFPGWEIAILVLLAIADRLRGPRRVEGEDPRWAMIAGGLLIVWCTIQPTRVPGLGITLISPFMMLRDVVPGLKAVRALASVAIGLGIVTSFLAAYGTLALISTLRLRERAQVALVFVLTVVLIGVRFYTPLAHANFGRTLRLNAFEARPPESSIALLRATGRGPTIDYPLRLQDGSEKRLDVAEHLLLASYDPRPQAGCYNSFQSPVNDQVMELIGRLPAPAATDALAALGFETLLVHERRIHPDHLRRFHADMKATEAAGGRLQPLGETSSVRAYRVTSDVPVRTDLASLGPVANELGQALPPKSPVVLPVGNPTSETFRLTGELGPAPLVLRWLGDGGRVVQEKQVEALLPVALGPGDSMPLRFDVETPPPGTYRVTLARAEEPDRPIAARTVVVPHLRDVTSPAVEINRLNRDFVFREILPRGMAKLSVPEDVVDMVLAPSVQSADQVRSAGRLLVRWVTPGLELVSESTIDGSAVEVTDDPRLVRVTVPVPARAGRFGILVSPADEPRKLLATALATPDPASFAGGAKEARPAR